MTGRVQDQFSLTNVALNKCRRVTKQCLVSLSYMMLTGALLAQLPAPNDLGVAMGHLHLLGRDLEAHHKFWTEALGGTPVTLGQLKMYKFPDVLVLVVKGEPKSGSVGTTVNHLGFKVKDLAAAVAKVKASGFKVTSENPETHQAFALTPDNVRLELCEDKTMSVPIAHHHIHIFDASVADTKAWYVKTFGAKPGRRGQFEAADLPGVNLSFSKSETPVVGTQGSAIDHIGFEVRGLEAFMKKLESDGVKINLPYRNIPALGISIAFLTDPWGTYIELTEGLDKVK